MEFDKGYISPYFATDAAAMVQRLKMLHILIYEQKSVHRRHAAILEQVAKTGKSLVVTAEDLEARPWPHWL